jgi:hypothetical protein
MAFSVLITEWYMMKMMPAMGFGVLFVVPRALILAVIMFFLCYKWLLKLKCKPYVYNFILVLLFITQFTYQYLFHFQDGFSPYKIFKPLNTAFQNYDELLISDYIEYNNNYSKLALDYKFKHFAPDFILTFYLIKPNEYSKWPQELFDDQHQIANIYVSNGTYFFNNDNITFNKRKGLFILKNNNIKIKEDKLLVLLNDSKIRYTLDNLNSDIDCQLYITNKKIKRADPGFKTYLSYHLITLFYQPYPINSSIEIRYINKKKYCSKTK